MQPLVDLRWESEDRAAIARSRTPNRKSRASLPALCGANSAFQVRGDLFPGLQRVAAKLWLATVAITIAIRMAVFRIDWVYLHD